MPLESIAEFLKEHVGVSFDTKAIIEEELKAMIEEDLG